MGLSEAEKALMAEIDKEFSEELRKEENTIEALLFAMGRSVSIQEICTALETTEEPALQAVERLIRRYQAQQGGIEIIKIGDNYQMTTSASCFEGLIRVAKHPQKPVLTDIVMETLAIIAYKQPITKAEIERIRGVKSDHAVNRLVEYNLVYEVGRLNAPGRPALFATTEDFLRRFGVSSLEQLPALNPEIAEEIRQQVDQEVIEVMGTPDPEEMEETENE